MSPILSAVIAIAAILLIANLLIVAHELGHYVTARALGIMARCFIIGFGPILFRRTDRNGTHWSLAALPLGGFVEFRGEWNSGGIGGDAARSPLARMAIILAGPATNLALAFAVFAALFGIDGTPSVLPVASTVEPGSAAAQAGLRPGDRIEAVRGEPVATFEDMRPLLQASPGHVVAIEDHRGSTRMVLSPRPGMTVQDRRIVGYLGAWSSKSARVRLGALATIEAAATSTWHAITDTARGVARAVTTGRGTENFAGVLGITQLAGEAARAGDSSIFKLIAILSANLAQMNMLPIPVLDGGAFLFCLIERVRGRPVSSRITNFATHTGVAAIATIFMLSMLHDLAGFGLFRLLGRP